MSEKIAEIVEKIKELTLVEASELKKALEDEFGVTAAAPVVMGGVAPAVKLRKKKKKQNLMLFSQALAKRKLTLLRLSELIQDWDLKKPKSLLIIAPNRLKSRFRKMKLKQSRKNSKKQRYSRTQVILS